MTAWLSAVSLTLNFGAAVYWPDQDEHPSLQRLFHTLEGRRHTDMVELYFNPCRGVQPQLKRQDSSDAGQTWWKQGSIK